MGFTLVVVLSACGVPRIGGFEKPPDFGAIYTAAAQTVVAQATLASGQTAVAQLTQIAQHTATPSASPSPTPTATDTPSPTPTDTPTPTATFTPLPPTATFTATPIPPTATPRPIPCHWAQFVSDVTVPDGSVFAPGAVFTKTWRLRNIGSCTWNMGYYIVYVSGERMQTRNAFGLPRVVRPGETVDVSAEFVAPSNPGRYRSNWMLSDPFGNTFGIGTNAQRPFWVEIVVKTPPPQYPFDFTAQMCNATWRNATRSLPCPGNPSSPDGSVVLLTAPLLENGRREDEPTLWTRPEQVRGGLIQGIYPLYRVREGDHFMADLGCLANSRQCNVTFYLDYKLPGKAARNLGSWNEVYDGRLTRVVLDLSRLAGSSVQFILRVENNGKAADANAFWLMPSIRRGVSPDPESIPAVQAARAEIAAALGIAPTQLAIVSAEAVQWSDSCLGVYRPGEVCAEMIVPGYRVIFTYNGRYFEAHTDQNGDLIFWFETT